MGVLDRFKVILSELIKEGLDPKRASAAVFIGVFVGVVPIYGAQSLVAIGLAIILKLNKPLTFACTFINNPILQPFLILISIEIGHCMLDGHLLSLSLSGVAGLNPWNFLADWFAGSIALALFLGSAAALGTYFFLHRRPPECRLRRQRHRELTEYVNSLFQNTPSFDRGFVKWKLRLDKIFDLLAAEDLGNGPVIDLGCGYGIMLAIVAFQSPGRHLIGCDLDARRIGTARQALGPLGAELSIGDVRTFESREATGLIMIFDVLQYLSPSEQQTLIEKWCTSLSPGGKMVFRAHDREHGLFSRLSLVFDKMIFFFSRRSSQPTILPASKYREILERSGMRVQQRYFVNRLPLAHILFIAEKLPGTSLCSTAMPSI